MRVVEFLDSLAAVLVAVEMLLIFGYVILRGIWE